MTSSSVTQPVYRQIDSQWRKAGVRKDPHVSVVLDALALMIDDVAGRVVRAGMFDYFDSFRSIGYRKIPSKLDVRKRELLVLHYPLRATPRDLTTANHEGVLVAMPLVISCMAIVGLPAWGAETLMAQSADVPELLWAAYLANAKLRKSDGAPLLAQPLTVGEFTFGSLPYAGGPVGWRADITSNLQWHMKNWLHGDQ